MDNINKQSINNYDDLVPYSVICGCTYCSCTQGCKLVPNPAKYSYGKTWLGTTDSSTILKNNDNEK